MSTLNCNRGKCQNVSFNVKGKTMSNSLKARKAIRKIFGGKYIDAPITKEEVDLQWDFLMAMKVRQFRLIKIINDEEVDKELLQNIFDALNICDVA